MTRRATTLLEEALQLSPEDRARIAAKLLSSLDERDEDVKAAWAMEIARRSVDAEANPDDEEDWRTALEDVRRDVLAR
jgi:putative addiction module component (TIGR02574 family)